MPLYIRGANHRDMPAIVRMIGEFGLDYENLRAEQFVVAEDGCIMVGFGRLKPNPDSAEIGCIGVLHERRREGIGKLIVDELIRRGPDEVWITTEIPEYFEALGFVQHTSVPASIEQKLKRFRENLGRRNIVAMRRIKV
jgi:N-acetylglutamate synthase-like GNAT family acetyltransferase